MDTPYLDIFTEHLRVERNASKNTLEAYLKDVISVFAVLEENNPDKITPKELVKALENLSTQGNGLKPRSQARKMSALRVYFKFLAREGLIPSNPMLDLEMPKQGRSLPKHLSESEVSSLLEHVLSLEDSPENIRLICLLEILYASGLRVSELVSLRYGAVMSALRSEQTPAPLIVTGKGSKDRLVLLSDSAIRALQKYLTIRGTFIKGKQESQWLFPSSAAQGYITRQRFGQLLKEVAREANLNPNKVSPHVIRHAFATHMLGRGADLLSLQKLLGHSDISTTEIYTHVTPDHLEETLRTYHPLSKMAKPSNDY